MRVTKENAEKTRVNLLNAALKVFSEKGFSATRIEDISKTAGVTRGAFYWHFTDKLDIFIELYFSTHQILLESIIAVASSNASPVEKIRTFLINLGVAFYENSYYRSIGVLHYKIEHTADVRAALGKRIKMLHQRDNKIVFNLIKEAKAAGEIVDHIDDESIEQLVRIFIMGFVTSILDENTPLGRTRLESVVDIFLRSIRA